MLECHGCLSTLSSLHFKLFLCIPFVSQRLLVWIAGTHQILGNSSSTVRWSIGGKMDLKYIAYIGIDRSSLDQPAPVYPDVGSSPPKFLRPASPCLTFTSYFSEMSWLLHCIIEALNKIHTELGVS